MLTKGALGQCLQPRCWSLNIAENWKGRAVHTMDTLDSESQQCVNVLCISANTHSLDVPVLEFVTDREC